MMRVLRYIIPIIVMVAVVAVSHIVLGGQWVKDNQVNKAIEDVTNGKATKKDISVLEKAVEQDPNNADLVAVLAGANGLVAEAEEDEALGNKAEELAQRAHKLNPNSIAAQIAMAGVNVQSANEKEQEQAIQFLQKNEGKAPKVAKYLRGKGLILQGKADQGENLLDQADIPAAKRVKADKQKMLGRYKEKAKRG